MNKIFLPLLVCSAGSLSAQITFSAANLPVGLQPDEVVFGDVDLDGDLDLLVTVDNPINGVSVWSNDGAGNFSLLQNILVANQSRTLLLELSLIHI